MKVQKICISAVLLTSFLMWTGERIEACDTWVAKSDATSVNVTLLAKNSDRTVFDCQPLFYHAAREWPAGSMIDLGRISIPQVERTYATIGSSPYWCWGYEEGMNEYGVAIGNEGIATRPLSEIRDLVASGQEVEYGPTGMDLLRLGLERGKTAREALDVITSLLEQYGQFGSGLPTLGVEAAYDNSFLIADREEAWILETAGRQWAARIVSENVASISNKISITTDWDAASEDLKTFAQTKKWYSESSGRLDFDAVYGPATPGERIQNQRAQIRADRSCRLLQDREGSITSAVMMEIARDRGTNPSLDLDVTASACVAEIPDNPGDISVFWWAPSVPSTSCYVPFFIKARQIPGIVSRAGTSGRNITRPSTVDRDGFKDDSYWWLFRDLADLVNLDRETHQPVVRQEFDALETDFRKKIPAIKEAAAAKMRAGEEGAAAKILAAFSQECVDRAVAKVNELRDLFRRESAAFNRQLDPYIGSYTANFGTFQNSVFQIEEKNHLMTLIIPGRGELSFNYPGENGYWMERMSNMVALTFEQDSTGMVIAMVLHQTTPFTRKAGSDEPVADEVPDEIRDLPGTYELAAAGVSYKVFIRDMALFIDIGNQRVLRLIPTNSEGIWQFEGDPSATVSFGRAEDGSVTFMNLNQSFPLPRGLSAAYAAEEIIRKGSLNEALKSLHTWKNDPVYFIDEADINALGYRLLNDKKTEAALEIFKFNVECYPESFNVYDSLGEAYMITGDKEAAIHNYKKSLELNSENEGGREMLKKLEGQAE